MVMVLINKHQVGVVNVINLSNVVNVINMFSVISVINAGFLRRRPAKSAEDVDCHFVDPNVRGDLGTGYPHPMSRFSLRNIE